MSNKARYAHHSAELIRLHILHHASDGAFYGQWMIDELARHGYKLNPGTLYPSCTEGADYSLDETSLPPRKDLAPPDLRPYLLTQSLHQPRGLIGPSTSVQEDGRTKNLQFAQFLLPFGEFR